MSSIVTAVFKVTIGLLVNKGRDKAVEKLKDGDVTDQKFRCLIVREIDDIKSKLDGLSRKDLLASISFFEEGIELLYEVFDKARSRNKHGAVTTRAACAEAISLAKEMLYEVFDKARSRNKHGAVTTRAACAEPISLAKEMRTFELNDLDDSATRALSNAKKRFEDSRREATRAFKNEALETSDRILAMQYRVMATILETVDNPTDAVAPCRVCVKELNSLLAVQNSFDVQLKKGIRIQAARGWFGKDERKKIISDVCHLNRVIFDVSQTVGQVVHFSTSPTVDIGEDKVDPLRDERVAKVLRKQGMEHCCVTAWSFGEHGQGHKLKNPCGIATNSSGQVIVGDRGDSKVKVFDSSGTFLKLFSLPNDDAHTKLDVLDVATDMKDNIYVLVRLRKRGAERYERAVYELNNTADLQHTFPVRGRDWDRLTVTDSGKVLVLSRYDVVSVYEADGEFVREFGEDILKDAWDITAANDGRVMVVDCGESCVQLFSEHGDYLSKFKLQGCYSWPRIAFHRASEHVVVADIEREKRLLHVDIYTKDGEFVRGTQIHEEGINHSEGITVITEGRIAVVCWYKHSPPKVLVI